MSNIEVVREDDVQDETRLVDVGGGSTALAGEHMVMWQPGRHFSVVARNASSPTQAI